MEHPGDLACQSQVPVARQLGAIGVQGHIIQLQDFVDAIREDRDPMVTGEAARAAVEIILAIYQSAKTGEAVRLPLSA